MIDAIVRGFQEWNPLFLSVVALFVLICLLSMVSEVLQAATERSKAAAEKHRADVELARLDRERGDALARALQQKGGAQPPPAV